VSTTELSILMVLDLFKLDGRVAVVTGGGRGLGQAMAGALAQAGADVVSVTRTAQSEETRQLVEGCGRTFVDMQCDVGQPSERAGLIERITAQMGRVDILVNNAGIFQRHPPEDYPLAEFDELMQVHLHAAFDLSQQTAPQMLERGRGKIINIGSVLTFEGGLNIPAYAAAKHALAGLTKSLANSWSHRGINVNCIAPGYFDTRVADSLKDDPVRGPQILDRIPAGRWGDPDELGRLAVFLASDASNYVHGSVIAIDGGWLAR